MCHTWQAAAAIHTLTDIFETDECEAMLFVDASNAFNSINRQVALQNIQRIVPLFAPMIINTYRNPAHLFIDGESIMSSAGVTQGDPLAMAFYAIATIPLIEKLRQDTSLHNARFDVPAQEFWDKRRTTAFFDVKVFNAHAPSNRSSSTASCYRRHELEKRRKYERRVIDVEHGTFTPFIMSSSGGMGPSATVTIKRLASLIAEKADTPYSVMLNVIRCKLSFSLVDSAIMCSRGARSSLRRPAVSFDSSLVPDPVCRPPLYSPPPRVWKRDWAQNRCTGGGVDLITPNQELPPGLA